MRFHLIAAGHKLPAWINQGFEHYNKRIPADQRIQLREVPVLKRGKQENSRQILEKESEVLWSCIPPRCQVWVLAIEAKRFSTAQFATQLDRWRQQGEDVAFVIGGPDGLAPTYLARAHGKISLSEMTFPHGLVRVMFMEQYYRAWSLLQGHPYHRP